MFNEFIYENFYEIYAYSIPYIVIYFTYGKVLKYRIRGSNNYKMISIFVNNYQNMKILYLINL